MLYCDIVMVKIIQKLKKEYRNRITKKKVSLPRVIVVGYEYFFSVCVNIIKKRKIESV